MDREHIARELVMVARELIGQSDELVKKKTAKQKLDSIVKGISQTSEEIAKVLHKEGPSTPSVEKLLEKLNRYVEQMEVFKRAS